MDAAGLYFAISATDGLSAFQGLIALVSLIVAYKALRASSVATDAQTRIALAAVRPWVVWDGPCILKKHLAPGQHIEFQQMVKSLGNFPPVDLRFDAYFIVAPTAERLSKVSPERIRINRRAGEGALLAMVPGHAVALLHNPTRQRPLSDENFSRIAAGTHFVRIILIIEYSGVVGGEIYRTIIAADCDQQIIISPNASLQPTPDGMFIS